MAQPTLISELMLDANPTASYFDTLAYADECVAYWRFNSASSFDDEIDVTDGTIHGAPSLVTSLLPLDSDQALRFDGVDDYIAVDSTASLLQAGSWTFEGLVRFHGSTPGALKPIATKGAFSLEIRADDYLQFTVQNHVSGVSTRTTVVGTTPLDPDTEYHVECIHDAAAGEIRIALDGRVEAIAAHTAGTELWGLPLLFGARHGGTTPSFRSASAIVSVSAGAAFVFSKPAGLAVGDLMLAHFYVSQNNLVGARLDTMPSGWTVYGTYDFSDSTTVLAFKTADAADVAAASFTFDFETGPSPTLNSGDGVLMAFSGVDPVNPFANPAYLNATANTSALTSGANYSQSDNVLTLGLACQRRNCSYGLLLRAGLGVLVQDLQHHEQRHDRQLGRLVGRAQGRRRPGLLCRRPRRVGAPERRARRRRCARPFRGAQLRDRHLDGRHWRLQGLLDDARAPVRARPHRGGHPERNAPRPQPRLRPLEHGRGVLPQHQDEAAPSPARDGRRLHVPGLRRLRRALARAVRRADVPDGRPDGLGRHGGARARPRLGHGHVGTLRRADSSNPRLGALAARAPRH
jgi:hypothetical protein